MLDRLDLDTEKPSEEELAKRFGYEDEYYNGEYMYIQASTFMFSSFRNQDDLCMYLRT